ncbi:TonB family protein [Lentisphaera profundi]|uniref:TonB family protein n=1 Tax=Lentisphaera profundi TaxID=1658616 RepID=A0ABY7VVH4_9BACT|nr:energy transducer TonB [Lentisphaera profundi]WDE97210.1 TonB family protein [Lentisphaera profundi]
MFAILFGSAFFLLLPFMNKANNPPEKIIEVREIPQFVKKKKAIKKTQSVPKKKILKKLKTPTPRPPTIEPIKPLNIKMDLAPISFASDIQFTPMSLTNDFNHDFDISPPIPAQSTASQAPSNSTSLDYSGVFELAEVDQQARRLKFVQPTYPRRAMQRGLTGTLSVEVLITKEGQVSTYKILESPHRGVFDKTCIKALLAENYKTALKNGRAVNSKRIINYDFRLK